ncbi:MAG: hypothetical protein AAGF01_30065 [Cyanobacteria bacterium P01_G01_bin.38]
MVNQRWIFVIRALDKPGTLTAAASVFSNRGVSLEGLLGSGIASITVNDARLLLSFRATEQKQAMLKRALERLAVIFKVDVYAYDDKRLRAIAVAKLTPDADVESDSGSLYVETIDQSETSSLLLLSGGTAEVENAIAKLRAQQQLKDVVMSTITV